MPPSAHPFVQYLWDIVSLEFMIKFVVFYFFLVWFCIVLWVAKDISERSSSILYQTICILLVIFGTPLSLFLYLLIRPQKVSQKKLLKEVEENLGILEEIIAEKVGSIKEEEKLYCPHCADEIQEDFIICPSCKTSLRHSCISCHKEIKQDWKVCPYCMTKQKKKKKTD